MEKKLKYFSLAVFLGIICKLYDDIVDNNLYSYFNISNENEPYFNEIMKSLFIIGYTVLSIEYPLFLIIFTIICLGQYINCNQDFNSYDFSCFVSPIILLPFLKLNNIVEYKKLVLWLFVILVPVGTAELISNTEKNKEYSTQKLVSRLFGLFIAIALVIYNSHLDLPNSLLPIILFLLGYSLVSCITQYCLLNGIWKTTEIKSEDEDIIQEKIEQCNNS
uniref:Uncharacterized protein n=1 Tax=viral metagenome TaxID=1070528 RepID=A0A6C0CQH3_9ZZZZ